MWKAHTGTVRTVSPTELIGIMATPRLQTAANSFFRNILPVSSFVPRFCGAAPC